MIIDTIAGIDTQIVSFHWRWLHAAWTRDDGEVVRAKAAIDVLLERRYELMQAAEAVATGWTANADR